MLSKKEKLLVRPWQIQRYENHKRKIKSAKPAIDVAPPPVYSHVVNKLKKLQSEKERLEEIKKENVRLLQRLGDIMTTKRLENFWPEPRPNFLGREKLFDIRPRPKTCKGRIESILKSQEVPSSTIKRGTTALTMVTISPISKGSARCPACSGKSIKRNQILPEERVPWQPSQKSWNVKIYTKEFQTHKCCKFCCT